jgi:hypothetical protein
MTPKHPSGPPMTMRHLAKAIIAATACLAATVTNAQSTSTQLGCDGQLIEPTTKASSPKSLQLTISSGKVGVDFGGGNIAAKIESNNNIQLKFKTDEFVGEYFHYTGDLFLIYKSGHLARLTCKRS